ncbi:18724_t:CDS:2, partial [Gigaspora margarita]
MSTLDFLQQCEEPCIADWVQDKKQSWVLASLSPAFTKMLSTVWANTPFTTNAEELSHSNINQSGPSEFDQFQWSSARTYEKQIYLILIGINLFCKEMLKQLKNP